MLTVRNHCFLWDALWQYMCGKMAHQKLSLCLCRIPFPSFYMPKVTFFFLLLSYIFKSQQLPHLDLGTWRPWLASWGLVCATLFVFQEHGQTGFFSPLWWACASPVLHMTLRVTLPLAWVGIAQEIVRGGEGAMSDFTGLSAFCAAGDCCLVAAECSPGRVARSCLAAQYLSSVCFGPTCLQDNYF